MLLNQTPIEALATIQSVIFDYESDYRMLAIDSRTVEIEDQISNIIRATSTFDFDYQESLDEDDESIFVLEVRHESVKLTDMVSATFNRNHQAEENRSITIFWLDGDTVNWQEDRALFKNILEQQFISDGMVSQNVLMVYNISPDDLPSQTGILADPLMEIRLEDMEENRDAVLASLNQTYRRQHFMARLMRRTKYEAYDLSRIWKPVSKPDGMWWDF